MSEETLLTKDEHKESKCGHDCSKHNTAGKIVARSMLGEIIGTFIMCFFGIGAVANATLEVSNAFGGPLQVGLVWGLSIAIAIYATRNLSCAHFNPAVTFAMCLSKRMPWKDFPIYVIAQFIGAILAAFLLWALFGQSCIEASTSVDWSSIWAERYPSGVSVAPFYVGAIAEGVGVFLLVFVIFSMTEDSNIGRPDNNLFPLFIGLAFAMIVCVIGSITDAGLNPARDMGPRIVAAIFNMKDVMSGDALGTVCVYVVGPLVGAALAALFWTKVVERHQHCGRCEDYKAD